MSDRIIIFLLFVTSFLPVFANSSDSLSTIYNNGSFVTYYQLKVNASDSICKSVANDFEYQLHSDLETLFGWALKGLNLRNEKNDLMVFYLKSTSYNKSTGVIRTVGDVIVPKIITFPNIILDSKIVRKNFNNKKSVAYFDLLYSDGFLKKMYGKLTLTPCKNSGTWFVFETHTKFGWFFNAFITQSRFKKIMEWRLRRFVYNIKEEAERREKHNTNLK
jgi:hypothetical protein